MKLSRSDLAAVAAILAALLLIYLPGLDNALVFDDQQLADRLIADYASFREFRVRMFSYGSFSWVQSLFGVGWWKQRIANLVIHLGVALALWALYREILRHIVSPPAGGALAAPAVALDRSPALGVSIGFFALNPVAVYAVAYLIQRSILLATFFVALGLWLFARGLASKRPILIALSLPCYALAVISKEHALLAPLAAFPLYILVARPGIKRLLGFAAALAVPVGLAGFMFRLRYGEIIGTPFDEFSRLYLAQLAKLDPGAAKNAYPLSILNQAYLFFEYGLRWFIPWTGWMSINMRPPFPITWFTFPQVLGIAGYAAAIVGGFYLVIRHRDWRALIGISLLFPVILFATEFATVWVQDPFVLYRSYLWAIGVPGIAFFFLHGTSPRTMGVIGIVAGCLLVWQAMDRVFSLSTPERAYSDAIEKLPNDPRAVGRWFPYLNRGNAYFDKDNFKLAERDFAASAALGDGGMGAYNLGALRLKAGRPREALAAFDEATRQGYDLFNLPIQKGMALAALGNPAEAYAQFVAAMKFNPSSPTREMLLLQLGRTALQLRKTDEAIGYFEAVLATDSTSREVRYVLAMALISKGEYARAGVLVDKLLAEGPTAQAFYARALVNHGLKRKLQARSDIDNAVRLGPNNSVFREWQAKIEAMP